MFGLIVVGSVVRTSGSGLACPDWPLCEGRLIPRLEIHVLIEWFHRLLALLVSLLLFTTVLWCVVRRELRARLGGLMGLAVLLLFAQVLLGALTVWKLLSPAVVSAHLAVALLLFVTLLVTSLIASTHPEPDEAPAGHRPAGLLELFALITLLTYAQSVLGGMVSSSQAGLACPDWPLCRGEWFPDVRGPMGLHMLHRYVGYTVALGVLVAAWAARHASDPRVWLGARMAASLVLAQVVLGVCNVLLGTPIWLTALHLATAAATLGMLVVTTWRVAALPARRAVLAPAASGAR